MFEKEHKAGTTSVDTGPTCEEDDVERMQRCLADLKKGRRRREDPEVAGSTTEPSESDTGDASLPVDTWKDERRYSNAFGLWTSEDNRFWRTHTDEELAGQGDNLADIEDHANQLIMSLYQLPDTVVVDAIIRIIVKIATGYGKPSGYVALKIAGARAVDYHE